ncbi:MAG: hypothetical protein ACM3JD_01225, partial [Rudaea sp.]
MKELHLLYHLARADFLERARRYSFLITLGLTILAAYAYLPSWKADYLTFGLGVHRGVYNSAWVGGAVAVLTVMFLSLPAFYLVKNAIERDTSTRVGQILATTPLTRIQYTLGKTLSNFLYLSAMVGVMAIAAGAMQLVRGEVLAIDPWALVSPFIFVVLPAMAVIAAMALLFEAIPWLRGTFGNVIYFFFCFGLLTLTALGTLTNPRSAPAPAIDLWGTSSVLAPMMRDTAAAFPDYSGFFSIGVFPMTGAPQTFVWAGVSWTPDIILGRLLWIGVAMGMALLAAVFFHRFDPAAAKPRMGRQLAAPSDLPEARLSAPSVRAAQLSPLSRRQVQLRFGSLVVAELRLMLKGIGWWWLALAVALIVAGAVVPLDMARQLLLVTWVLPLALWSSMGCRETLYRTNQLVFSAPHPLVAQLPAAWFAGVLVTFFMGSSIAVRLALAADWIHVLAWGTGLFFIPSLALAAGAVSRSSKLFEVIYMVLWYAGPVNRFASLDFMGAGEIVSFSAMSLFWLCTLGLLILSVWG